MLFFIILFKNSKELMKVFLLTSLALLALLVLSTSSVVDAQGGACTTAADCLNTALPHDYAGGPHSLCVSRLVFSSFWYV